MSQGDEVTIETVRKTIISGTVRCAFSKFVIVDDDNNRPSVVLKSDIKTFSVNGIK